MTRRMLLTIVAVVFAVLGVSQVAGAQTQYDFKISSSFVANGKTLPAGNYVFSVNPAGDLVKLESKDTNGSSALLAVETRVAERKPLADPELVFDKLNGQLLVSELLIPGEDGYLLLVTKGKHTHEAMKGARAKK
jgi:hypothetical protein